LLIIPFFVTAEINNIIYVDDNNINGPWEGTIEHPFQSIQDAINISYSGCTIYVMNGTYIENIYIDRENLKIVGEHKESTVIKGKTNEYVVVINASNIIISNFHIIYTEQVGRINSCIYIDEISDQCNISDNILSGGSSGITIYSHEITISHNTFLNALSSGISMGSYNFKSTIKDNNFYGGGIFTHNSINGIFKNNTIIDNRPWRGYLGQGMYFLDCKECSIISNRLIGAGIGIMGRYRSYWDSYIIENNTANNRPIYFYENLDGRNLKIPKDAAQIILYNCTNFIIKGLNTSNVTNAIQLGFSSNNFIENNTIENGNIALFLEQSTNNSINNNTIKNDEYGIWLRYSSFNYLFNNYFKSNVQGILLQDTISNIIKNNKIVNNYGGISSHDSNHSQISNNEINNNVWYGIDFDWDCINNIISNNLIQNNSKGISLNWRSNSNEIVENSIINNECGIESILSNENKIMRNKFFENEQGVHCDNSSNNEIIKNNILSNSQFGVNIIDSSYNKIEENNFMDNEYHAFFENSNNTLWSKNYWDNWNIALPKPVVGRNIVSLFNNKMIPWINFDWHPAKEPFDIE